MLFSPKFYDPRHLDIVLRIFFDCQQLSTANCQCLQTSDARQRQHAPAIVAESVIRSKEDPGLPDQADAEQTVIVIEAIVNIFSKDGYVFDGESQKLRLGSVDTGDWIGFLLLCYKHARQETMHFKKLTNYYVDHLSPYPQQHFIDNIP